MFSTIGSIKIGMDFAIPWKNKKVTEIIFFLYFSWMLTSKFIFSLTNSLIAKPIPKFVKHTIISITSDFGDKKIINKIEERTLNP